MNKLVTTLLSRWRDCAAKRVVQINRWLGESVEETPAANNSSQEPLLHLPDVEQDISSPSQDFDALCTQLANMVKNYDQLAAQLPDGEAKDLLTDMSEQIIASMNLGGCTPITKETSFFSFRHKPVPFSTIEDGTPIRATLRAGVELNGKVLIKAMISVHN